MSDGTTARTTAPITTAGVYQRAKRVIKFSLFDLFAPEFSTRSRIFDTVDSPYSRSTRTRITPLTFIHPEMTLSPADTFLGALSPVRAD